MLLSATCKCLPTASASNLEKRGVPTLSNPISSNQVLIQNNVASLDHVELILMRVLLLLRLDYLRRRLDILLLLLRLGQKRATKNRTPLEPGTIEASVNNGFPIRSGKKLQLETLDLDSRLIGL